MKRLAATLSLLALALPAAAQIDEETRQRAIAYVGGLRPPPGAVVEAPTGTLKKLADGGALHIGYRDDAFPLSFHGQDNQPAGLIWDLCAKVVVAAARQLRLANIPVVAVPVTPNTRELYLSTGIIDLECGATGNTLSRQRKLAFGVTTYVASVRLLASKQGGVNTLADLDNRTLISLSGSPAERLARTTVALRGSNIRHLQARDVTDALRLLEEGKGDAFVAEDITLALALAKLPPARAEKLRLTDDALAFEPQAIMLRKDDEQLKKLLDETLIETMKSGEFERLYQRWFESPTGSDGVNLKLPISDTLRNLLLAPNDRGV